MIPKPRFIVLFVVALVPLIFSVGSTISLLVGMALNLIVLAFALLDFLGTPSPKQIEIHRVVPEILSVGTGNAVSLQLLNRSRSLLAIELTDEYPQPGKAEGLPLRFLLQPWKEQSGRYTYLPQKRGQREFTAVHLRYSSTFGLWTIMERRPLVTSVRVYPDVRAVSRFDLLAVKNRLDEIGLAQWRLRGQGGEFERLREYRREDEVRHIDWKATAKHQRLISREFTVERNQNIFILLDGGRTMCNETDGISHFDRGLNAALILSYIALSQGDNVGLMAFSSRIERFVRPVHSKPSIQAIIRQVFDLEPRLEASDYGMACEEVARRQRKRALLILISHTLDEQHLVTIESYVRTLTSTHLLLCVFLRDVALSELANRKPDSDVEAFHVSAAAELISSQARRISELRESGVLVLEALPSELSTRLINQYVDLKARQLL